LALQAFDFAGADFVLKRLMTNKDNPHAKTLYSDLPTSRNHPYILPPSQLPNGRFTLMATTKAVTGFLNEERKKGREP
jgi:hypothetical protein